MDILSQKVLRYIALTLRLDALTAHSVYNNVLYINNEFY
jgi:hypothetical protein